MGNRKTVELTVTVTVPAWMTKREAAREVRTNINHQSGYLSVNPRDPWIQLDSGDIKAKSVKPKETK